MHDPVEQSVTTRSFALKSLRPGARAPRPSHWDVWFGSFFIGLGVLLVVGTPMAAAQLNGSAAALAGFGVLAIATGVGFLALADRSTSPITFRRLGMAWNPWRITRHKVRASANIIGVRAPWNGTVPAWGVAIAIAVGFALLDVTVSMWISTQVDGPSSAEQLEAVAERSEWFSRGWPGHVPGLTLLSGVVSEELIYRSPLIALAALASVVQHRYRWTRHWPTVIVGVAVIGMAIGFGASHLEFSTANAVTSGVGGIVYGGLAVWTRSLAAPVAAHLTYNSFAIYIL